MNQFGDSAPTTFLLNALSAVLAQVAEPIQLLKTILNQAVTQTGADRGVFVEVRGADDFEYRVLHQYDASKVGHQLAPFSRTIFAEVLRSGQGVSIPDAGEDPRFMEQESVFQLRLVSVLCMPIKVDGTVVALVHLESNRTGHFKGEHLWLLRSLLDVAGPALKALRAAGELETRLSVEVEENRQALAREWSFGRFVGLSPCVRELGETVTKAASTDFPVLLLGETGTGKSVIARVLHHASARSHKAFVTVFCPSLEKSMLEPELFGHKKGAFTDAKSDRVGKVQAAEKGTLFLDEIAELPLEIQPKLLRLLQEKSYERVGDPEERHADVRVIAATNRDLEEEVAAGRFRRDLYARLNFIPVRIPPLRERRDDIPLLLRHCLNQTDVGRWIDISQEAYAYLAQLDFAWPENVRHLEQLAARLIMEKSERQITPADLQRLLAIPAGAGAGGEPLPSASTASASALELGLPQLLAQAEKAWLEKAMQQYGNLSRVEIAAKLKISESALYKKLRLYGIDR